MQDESGNHRLHLMNQLHNGRARTAKSGRGDNIPPSGLFRPFSGELVWRRLRLIASFSAKPSPLELVMDTNRRKSKPAAVKDAER